MIGRALSFVVGAARVVAGVLRDEIEWHRMAREDYRELRTLGCRSNAEIDRMARS